MPTDPHEPTLDLSWRLDGTAFGAVADDSGTIGSRGKPPGARGRAESAPFTITAPRLEFEIAGGDYEYVTSIDVLVDGRVVAGETGRRVDRPWAASLDLAAHVGRTATLRIVDEADAADYAEWGWIEVSAIRPAGVDPAHPTRPPLYAEALRPRFHLTARQWAMRREEPAEREEGWLNDLNGLVWHDGEFHLFAQRWNKCWVHAVSPDLVHWEELEPAFWEEALETGVQSGSCVVDVGNTSGLGDGTIPPMVAFWSRNDNRSQCLSYSLDRGRTWTHWAGNPLLDFPERDPMVFRDHASDRWAMVLYGDERYHFLVSDDLLHWRATGRAVGDSFECPDFFELPVLDATGERDGETRWVLVRGDGRYSIGAFDGEGFTEETGQLRTDVGANFYATQSWAAGAGPAPRRVQAAWMRGSVFPGMPFSQQVSLPCELTLRRTPDGIRMLRTPVSELAALERRVDEWHDRDLADGATWAPGTAAGQLRVRVEFDLDAGAELELRVAGHRVTAAGTSLGGDAGEGVALTPIRTLDVLVDVASIEVFVNDGELSATTTAFAGRPALALAVRGGAAHIRRLRLAELGSIWPTAAPTD